MRLLNGAQLDLGGIGKGFATDEVQAAWEQQDRSGTWSVLARLGGNVGAFGENPDRDGGTGLSVLQIRITARIIWQRSR